MGEEAKQAKQEEKKEARDYEKPAKEKKESKPPSPVALYVDLHCAGCAKKIEKLIMKVRGVEEIVMDMDKNEVTIEGSVEPEAICRKIMNMTKRNARVISPLPAGKDGESINEVSRLTTVQLNTNIHCEACAEQLKKKILHMRGVHMATTELSGKVTVTGTMDADKLVDYVYRRTRKQARIVPQPETEIEEEEGSKEAEKSEEDNAEKKEKGKTETVEVEQAETDNENGEEFDTKKMMYYYHYPVYQPLYVMERVPPPQLFSDENPNACCIS